MIRCLVCNKELSLDELYEDQAFCSEEHFTDFTDNQAAQKAAEEAEDG